MTANGNKAEHSPRKRGDAEKIGKGGATNTFERRSKRSKRRRIEGAGISRVDIVSREWSRIQNLEMQLSADIDTSRFAKFALCRILCSAVLLLIQKQGERMSSFSQILPLRNSNLWKGVGIGAVCVLALAIAIPNLMRVKVASYRRPSGIETYAKLVAEPGVVEAEGPKIIRTAELNLLVADCEASLKDIEELAKAESGFVESSTLEEGAATITVRVPTARLDEVRARIRKFATRVTQDSVGASDVTKQYIDREARLRNLRAQEQQFLEVMKKAHTVPDVLAVTKNLSEVRGEIEEQDADFRNLKDQVDMAKIEARLHAESIAGVHWSAGSSARSAWNDFLQSLASIGDFLIWTVVNLPVIILWIIIVFLLVAVGWYVLRAAIRAMKALFGRKGGVAAER